MLILSNVQEIWFPKCLWKKKSRKWCIMHRLSHDLAFIHITGGTRLCTVLQEQALQQCFLRLSVWLQLLTKSLFIRLQISYLPKAERNIMNSKEKEIMAYIRGLLFGHRMSTFSGIPDGEGVMSEETIDDCVVRLMTVRMRLGMFDEDENVEYASIPYVKNNCSEHRSY